MQSVRKIIDCLVFGVVFALGCFFMPAGFLMEAEAATTLETPEPYVSGGFTAAWDRVEHASAYEIRISMQSMESGKTVTRTLKQTANKADLALFAAGNGVSFEVRAISGNTNKYKNSAWGESEDDLSPLESNTVQGFPNISGGRLYMTNDAGKKLSGWQLINGGWYYFDPADKNYAASGWKVIDGAWYYFGDTWKMQTGWADISNHWYFFSTAAGSTGKMVTGWVSTSPNNICYFTETATTEYPLGSLNETITKASYPNSRPPYQLNPSGSSSQVNPAPSSGGTLEPQNYWQSNPGGSWSYYKAGKQVKGSWEQIDGFWYYFNSSGQMLTGWQYIGGCWYYLEPNAGGSNGYKQGAMWVNTTTPDGYTVNAEGKWVENGVVVTNKNGSSGTQASGNSGTSSGASSSSYGSLKQITRCTIRLNITDGASGYCRNCTVTGATNSTVKSVTYSTPYENWSAGSAITITVQLEPQSNYTYTTGTKFTVSGAEVKGHSGDSLQQTVRLSYTPTIRLDTPGCIYLNDSETLMWMPVSKAKRYRLTLSGGEAGTKTYTLDEASFDLSEYGDIHSYAVKAQLSSLGSQGNTSYTESERVTISNLEEYQASHTMNGTFEKDGSKVRYRDESGEVLKGWQNLCGSWYHFKNTGWADGPGWYQDSTGYWYYFDGSYRMLTGNINVNGTDYFLNDGSRSGLPLGAWVN